MECSGFPSFFQSGRVTGVTELFVAPNRFNDQTERGEQLVPESVSEGTILSVDLNGLLCRHATLGPRSPLIATYGSIRASWVALLDLKA